MSDAQDRAHPLGEEIFTPPPGVRVQRGPGGLSLHVTTPVRAGEVIYRAHEITIADDGRTYLIHVQVGDEVEDIVITSMHTVRYMGVRTFDIPGCFMNHSCDPTSVSRDVLDPSTGKVIAYEQIATRNLYPGDEITCDYTLFDWDCDGHQFHCHCGSDGCYGFIGGFRSLDPATQQRFQGEIYYETERMWHHTRT